MRTFFFVFAVGGLGLSGCDSLKARMVAQDAVKLYHDGKIADAASKFEVAEKLAPTIPTIQLNLGYAYLALYQGAPEGLHGAISATKAIRAFERYLRLKPHDERAETLLVQTFTDTGHYDDAVKYFQPEVDGAKPSEKALKILGNIASKTGRYDEAKQWYQKRVETQPTSGEARLALGVLIWDHLHSHTDVVGPARIEVANLAIEHLGEAIKLQPNAPNAYMYTNLVYRERANGQPNDELKRGDLEQASKFFKLANDLQKKGGR